MTSNPHQQTYFSFFMPPKSFNKQFEFLLYKTNRLHFSVCAYCNRSQRMSPLQHVKKSRHSTSSCAVLFVLYTLCLCDIICELLQYKRTEKCNLFITVNNTFLLFKALYVHDSLGIQILSFVLAISLTCPLHLWRRNIT